MVQELQLPRALRPIRRAGFFGTLRTVLNGYSHGLCVERCLTAQLAKRERSEVEEVWEGSNIPKALRKDICEIIRRETSWPNDYYMPSDRMEYLLMTHWGGLEINQVFIEIEKRYRIAYLDEVIVDVEDQTLEDFLCCIVAKVGG
jgi:hypothetical protein